MFIKSGLFLFLLAVLQVSARFKSVNPDFNENNINQEPAPLSSSSRIVSGWLAQPGQFPYHASLRFTTQNGAVRQCGGSIVSREWIITSAFCTANCIRVQVHAGGVSFTNSEYLSTTTEWYSHPHWPMAQSTDIAIVKLQRPVVYTRLLQRIRVQSRADAFNNYQHRRVIATGHGNIRNSGTTSDVLRWVYLWAISNTECGRIYSNGVHATTICAEYSNVTSQGTCYGDNGGPLVHVGSDGIPTLIGVSYFHSVACERALPSGFTRPGPFLTWFQQVTGIDFENLQEDTTTTSTTTTTTTTTPIPPTTTTTTTTPTTPIAPTTTTITTTPTTPIAPTTTTTPTTSIAPTTTSTTTTPIAPTTTSITTTTTTPIAPTTTSTTTTPITSTTTTTPTTPIAPTTTSTTTTPTTPIAPNTTSTTTTPTTPIAPTTTSTTTTPTTTTTSTTTMPTTTTNSTTTIPTTTTTSTTTMPTTTTNSTTTILTTTTTSTTTIPTTTTTSTTTISTTPIVPTTTTSHTTTPITPTATSTHTTPSAPTTTSTPTTPIAPTITSTPPTTTTDSGKPDDPDDFTPIESSTTPPEDSDDKEEDKEEDSDSSESNEDNDMSQLLKRLQVNVKVKVRYDKYKNM